MYSQSIPVSPSHSQSMRILYVDFNVLPLYPSQSHSIIYPTLSESDDDSYTLTNRQIDEFSQLDSVDSVDDNERTETLSEIRTCDILDINCRSFFF